MRKYYYMKLTSGSIMIDIIVIMKRVYYLLIISAEVEVSIMISGLLMFLKSFK